MLVKFRLKFPAIAGKTAKKNLRGDTFSLHPVRGHKTCKDWNFRKENTNNDVL